MQRVFYWTWNVFTPIRLARPFEDGVVLLPQAEMHLIKQRVNHH